MKIRPITFHEACEFISRHHRHSRPTVGCKFCIGLFDNAEMVGCAVCGRPVARRLDDGLTVEINRLCTDGTRNACSMLYGAACRVAKAMGYEKAVTFTLMSENGASLKASGFTLEAENCGGIKWTGPRDKGQDLPKENKKRWIKYLQEDKG